ncbi:hypothetical protein GC425_02270 [Corynebacterium sp. zg254]|uniref:DUF2269 domain-containing protein n=1 Tax=Corynebacterium zhongnanshanii TaxID=2768834 RepID=A0ABQ6VG72_9CORY|nr:MULTISPECIES: hypothetical protein [Corynebacterium]KAB3523194.1 hypothetical protein F8377_03355 [Corynebacterium zhongnanshanii]MCR5913695.1 hypothetical protein [Corynebacterium sp. zg254]
MDNIMVILHVLAAILLIGPVTISTSMFAPQFRRAVAGEAAAKGALRILAGITRTYGYISLLVPVLGIAAWFTVEGAMQRYNFHAAILLAVIAWVLLVAVVIPKQRVAVLAAGAQEPGDDPATPGEEEKLRDVDVDKIPGQTAMFGGIFNLLWFITAVLMFF